MLDGVCVDIWVHWAEIFSKTNTEDLSCAAIRVPYIATLAMFVTDNEPCLVPLSEYIATSLVSFVPTAIVDPYTATPDSVNFL